MSSTSILAYLILTLSIGYAFAYPLFEDIQGLIGKRDKLNDSLEKIVNIDNKKEALLSEFNQIPPETRKDIETALPNSLDFVRLVSQIDAVAAKYGISIDSISSKELNSYQGNAIEGATPSKPYFSAIVGFSFSSSYETFNLFMKDLEKSLRILDVRSVKLQTGEKGVYTYNVEFETYWFK